MNSAGHAASHPGWCSPAAPYLSNPLHHALSMPPSLGPLSARGVLDAAAEAGAAAAVAAVAATNAVAQQKAALSAAQQLEQQQQLAGPGSGGRGRARKADWVIVTEETAIKNAAGAIAKVRTKHHTKQYNHAPWQAKMCPVADRIAVKCLQTVHRLEVWCACVCVCVCVLGAGSHGSAGSVLPCLHGAQDATLHGRGVCCSQGNRSRTRLRT